jgi:hypothetical protein
MALFTLGLIAATPGAMAVLTACGGIPISYLARHAGGDFGVICEADQQENLRAIRDRQGRVLSAYALPASQRIWIITNLAETGGIDTCLLAARGLSGPCARSSARRRLEPVVAPAHDALQRRSAFR